MAGCGEVGSKYNCDSVVGLLDACISIIQNAGLLRDWVNGDEDTEVLLGNKLTPSIRNLVQQIYILKNKVVELLNQIINKVNEAYQLGHLESIVTLSPGITIGQTVTIPIEYIVGYNNLQINWEGMSLFRNHMYEEVGNVGDKSNKIKYLIEIPMGKRIRYWAINSNLSLAVEEALRRLDEATIQMNNLLNQITIYTEHTLQTVKSVSEIVHDGYYLIGTVPNVRSVMSTAQQPAIEQSN